MRLGLAGVVWCAYAYHEKAKESVVALQYTKESKGTGFAISKNGLALSSSHVLEAKHTTTVGGEYIEVLAYDKDLDIALLQLPRHKTYSYLKLGSSEQTQKGERLHHYGYAFTSLVGFTGFLQNKQGIYLYSSAEMMHGMSGGPLLNSEGEVIGVNKGHYYCSPQRRKELPYHTGPSVYIAIEPVKEFLLKHCKETWRGWEYLNK